MFSDVSVRLVYPTVTSTGLGNNIIPVAKAYLIAQSCKMTYQPPVWPPCEHVKPPTLNGYGYYFPSTIVDKLKLCFISYQYRIQRKVPVQLWPTLRFDREDYERAGVVDIGDACLEFLKERGLDDPLRSLVVTTGGIWTHHAYVGIKRARPWIKDLLTSHTNTRRRLTEIEQRTAGQLRVAINIRMKDFKPRKVAGPIQEGERVVRLPMEWYAQICRLIREVCDCTFILVTDGKREELLPFLQEFEPVNIIGEPYQDLLGALLMSISDLVICSNSTYSRLGAFLNDKPYIWCADTLVRDSSGRFGYLWKDGGNPVPASDRSDPNAIRRCFAFSVDFSTLPSGLMRYLTSNGEAPIEMSDDLLYADPVYLM